MAKQSKEPFAESRDHLISLGYSYIEAGEAIQKNYTNFVSRIERLKDNQQNQGNSAQVQLISHVALLATLTITVLGFLLSQAPESLNERHKALIIVVIGLEVISLFYSIKDYWQTINFHIDWAKKYANILDDTGTKIDEGKIQWNKDLIELEKRHYKNVPDSTDRTVTKLMIKYCLAGLVVALVLFIAFLFDIPYVE